MAICETLPICPDVVLDADADEVLTEPIEVGPYTQGVVFVHVTEITGSAVANVDVGISPSGYEDWEHWAVLDSMTGLSGVDTYALQVSNFGNWLRLRLGLDDPDDADELTMLAWFVGDG
jgi:hypothetical protein